MSSDNYAIAMKETLVYLDGIRAEDYNKMARQIDAEPINDKEDLEKIINGSAYAAKRDGVRTSIKLIEEL